MDRTQLIAVAVLLLAGAMYYLYTMHPYRACSSGEREYSALHSKWYYFWHPAEYRRHVLEVNAELRAGMSKKNRILVTGKLRGGQ